MNWDLKDPNIKRLKNTEWTDTYDVCGDKLIISRVEKLDGKNMDEHYSVILEYKDCSNRRKSGIDFLDYIALGRYKPNNSKAEKLANDVHLENKYPTVGYY